MERSRFQELLERAKATKLALEKARIAEEAAKLHAASETVTTVDMTKMGVELNPTTPEQTEAAVDAIAEVIETAAAQPAPEVKIGVARKVTLNEKQQLACDMIVSGKSICLIGAAGTGKTTSMNEITHKLIESGRIPILTEGTKWLQEGRPGAAIVAFTRKATNNIRHAVAEELRAHTITIHKLLEFAPIYYEIEDPEKPGEFKTTMRFEPTRNASNPLPTGLKFIAHEESSMESVELNQLLKDAMPHDYQEIYLGDIQQLPPVFGLAILGFKMLELPVVELTEVYRQAMNSPIIRLAHLILKGNPHEFSATREQYFDERAQRNKWRVPALEKLNEETEFGSLFIQPWQKKISPDAALGAFVAQTKAWKDQGYYDPTEDMIICPFNVSFGTIEINKGIANYLGREREALVHEVIAGFEKHYLAVGDRVLYDKEDAFITSIHKNGNYMGAKFMPPSIHLDRWGAMQEELTEKEQAEADSGDADFDLEQIEAFLESAADSVDDRVNAASHVVTVKYAFSDEEVVLESASEIRNLLGGYAITAHKSQGSEWSKVFFVMHQSHAVMNSREILYTSITRAKKYLHIICEPDTLYKGVGSQRIQGDTLQQKAEFFKGKANERDKKLELEKKEIEREAQSRLTTMGNKPAIRLVDLPSPEIVAKAQKALDNYWQQAEEMFGAASIGIKPKLVTNIQSKRAIGQARYRKNELALNPVWLAAAEFDRDIYTEMMTDTIPHEIAHFVAYRKWKEVGHGKSWKYTCMRLGCKPRATAAIEDWQTSKRHVLEKIFAEKNVTEAVTDEVVLEEEE